MQAKVKVTATLDKTALMIRGKAMLDLSAVLLDPDLGCGQYDFERIAEGVGRHGYATESVTRGQFRGNIQPLSGLEHEFAAEGGQESASIAVYTPERLCAGGANSQPDRIFYRGGVFRVKSVENWTEQAGYFRAIAVLEKKHVD